jgi:hypothetical protein
MTLRTDLLSYQQKRKTPNWQPKASTAVAKEYKTPESEVVLRCLAFIDLEEKVGEWIGSLVTTPDNLDVNDILLRNVSDEKKHTSAIQDLRNYYNYQEKGYEWSEEAEKIVKAWEYLGTHPVLNAYVLECGIFFTILPLLQKLGDVYAATVAVWINDDERVHVETNLRLIKELGLKVSIELATLVYQTVHFIYEPLGDSTASYQAARAVRRVVTTKDPDMLKESLPVTISYFEQESNQSIVY